MKIYKELFNKQIPPKTTAVKFMQWLDNLINSVPVESRDDIEIMFYVNHSTYYPHMAINYFREETEDETEKRKEEEEKQRNSYIEMLEDELKQKIKDYDDSHR